MYQPSEEEQMLERKLKRLRSLTERCMKKQRFHRAANLREKLTEVRVRMIELEELRQPPHEHVAPGPGAKQLIDNLTARVAALEERLARLEEKLDPE